jgi:hypothetical protein
MPASSPRQCPLRASDAVGERGADARVVVGEHGEQDRPADAVLRRLCAQPFEPSPGAWVELRLLERDGQQPALQS